MARFHVQRACAGEIGTAGFCLGGRYGLIVAARHKRIAACLAYYPTIETPPLPGQDEDVVALAAEIACPVHMITAGKDHLTSREVFLRLQASLQSRAVPTTIALYPKLTTASCSVTEWPTKPPSICQPRNRFRFCKRRWPASSARRSGYSRITWRAAATMSCGIA